MDQGSNKNHSPAYNFTPTVTKFCVMWEGLSLPHDTKFGNCRCKIVDSRSFHSWSLIHGLRWTGLIKVGPGGRGVAWLLIGWWAWRFHQSATLENSVTHHKFVQQTCFVLQTVGIKSKLDMVNWLQAHPVLFNKKFTSYKDTARKELLWKEIAE